MHGLVNDGTCTFRDSLLDKIMPVRFLSPDRNKEEAFFDGPRIVSDTGYPDALSSANCAVIAF